MAGVGRLAYGAPEKADKALCKGLCSPSGGVGFTGRGSSSFFLGEQNGKKISAGNGM